MRRALVVSVVVAALVVGAAAFLLTRGDDGDAPAAAGSATSSAPVPEVSGTTPALKDRQALGGMPLAAGAARRDGEDLMLACDAAPTYATPIGATTLTARVAVEGDAGTASVTVFTTKGMTATQVGFAAAKPGTDADLVAEIGGTTTVQLPATCSGASGVRVVAPAVGH